MKTWLVTPLGIVPQTDTAAITEAVEWVRQWTNSIEETHRDTMEAVDPEGTPTGRWEVIADDRAQDPMRSEVISAHPSKAEAEAEAARLNREIDDRIRSYILEDRLDLPDEVDSVFLSNVDCGRPYPQSRRCSVELRYQHPELGALDLSITVRWSSRFVAEDRDVHVGEVIRQVAAELPGSLANAVAAQRADLLEADEA